MSTTGNVSTKTLAATCACTQEQTRPDPKPGVSGLGPARVRHEGYFTRPGFSGRPEPVQCSSRSRYWLWNGHRQPSSRPWFISERSRGPTLQVPMWETHRAVHASRLQSPPAALKGAQPQLARPSSSSSTVGSDAANHDGVPTNTRKVGKRKGSSLVNHDHKNPPTITVLNAKFEHSTTRFLSWFRRTLLASFTPHFHLSLAYAADARHKNGRP